MRAWLRQRRERAERIEDEGGFRVGLSDALRSLAS
jgi:hypothetical protein